MRKRVLRGMIGILLCVCMMVAILPVGTMAASVSADYKVVLYQGSVTKNNSSGEPLNIGITGVKNADGSSTYTFEGVDFTTTREVAVEINDTNATIVLVDQNKLAVDGTGLASCQVIDANGNLTIEGSGSLTVTADDANNKSYGIQVYPNTLTIAGGSVTAIAGDAESYSYGILAASLVVSGGVVVAQGGDDSTTNERLFTYGIQAGSATFSGGMVTATAGSKGENSIGLATNNDAVFSGGTVIATSQYAQSFSNGISAGGNITISGGDIKATGNSVAVASPYSRTDGIFSAKTVSFEWGTVEATGDQYGIRATNGIITVAATEATKGDNQASAVPDENWDGSGVVKETAKYIKLYAPDPSTPPTPPPAPYVPIIYRADNFATAVGEFQDELYYGRAGRKGDVFTLKLSLSEQGESFGLDYKKITVTYEVEGAVQLGESYDYSGDPVYKDGIATDFMLGEGLNRIVATVYYNGFDTDRKFDPFYIYI